MSLPEFSKDRVLAHKFFARSLLLISQLLFSGLVHGQSFELLHSFNTGNAGHGPRAGLVQGSDGYLYGTTFYGGSNGVGTVFKMGLNGALTTLLSFNNTNGANPQARLIQARDGNLYGTTHLGGSNSAGTVFRMTLNGALTTLVSLSVANRRPEAGLVESADGSFYGTTHFGGSFDQGTVFKITTNGILTTLVSFNGTNGNQPLARLLQGRDGNLYGTTFGGGTNTGHGTVFAMTEMGMLTTLSSFGLFSVYGYYPYAALVQGKDGSFYGTTYNGGFNDFGTIFRLSPGGALTALFSFGGTNGANPRAELIEGRDGNFYGTTFYGGPNNRGTVYQVTTNGFLTNLVFFTGSNGRFPVDGLMQANDGNLYGTTSEGGANGFGSVFRIRMPSLKWQSVGAKLVLSWHTNLPGFNIQTTTNLFSPASWSDSTDVPVVLNGHFTITNIVSGPQQFFRLKR